MREAPLRLLLVTHRFPESGGRRPEKLAKYFPQFNVYPVVLTSRQLDETARQVLEHEFPTDLPVFRTPCLQRDPFKILRKIGFPDKWGDWLNRFFLFPDIYASWVFGAVVAGLKLLRRRNIDVILTTSPPESVHLVGYLLHRLTGVPWVADFRDLWTPKEINFRPATLFHRWLALRLEKMIFNMSSRVIANTPTNAAIYTRDLGVPKEKISVITNGFDPLDNPINGQPPQTDPQKLSFGYLGYLDKDGFPCWEILEIFAKFREEGIPVELHVTGYISNSALERIRRSGYDRFIQYTLQMPNFRAVPDIQQKSDLLLLLLYETDYSNAIVPLKLYSYLTMNRKVLAIAPEKGEAQRILSGTGLGEVFSIENRGKIVNFIRSAYREKQKTGQIAINPDPDELQKYNIVHLTERLSQIIKVLAHEGKN